MPKQPKPKPKPYTQAEALALQEQVGQLTYQLAAIRETDQTFYVGQQYAADIYRSRSDYDRLTVIGQAMLAWRVNPIARALVEITNDFVIGDGVVWDVDDDHSREFLQQFWNHDLNTMDEQLDESCDELTRTGDLFLLWSVADGFPYVRGVPSEQIVNIQTANNDYRQEQYYFRSRIDDSPWPAYNAADPGQNVFMRHYLINRPLGNFFGESDMGPVLKWLGRLTTLVEDRAILNHVANLVLLILEGDFKDDNERLARQAELNLHPPTPGSILVKNKSETWSTLVADLKAHDAAADILAVKRMIAAGWGVPLHYLAEPESATRTTADAAGTPTFRRFTRRQRTIKRVVTGTLQTALSIRRRVDPKIPEKVAITVTCDDVTERDNAALALAVNRIYPAVSELYDRHLFTEQELLDSVLRMMGQKYEKQAPRGLRRSLDKSQPAPSTPDPTATPPEEGE